MDTIVEQALAIEKSGKPVDALNMLFQAAQQQPNSAELWAHMALISIRVKQFDLTSQCLNVLPNFAKTFQDLNIPNLPNKTILFPILGWFFDRHDLVYNTLAQNGFFPVIMPQDLAGKTPLPDLTKENYKNYFYKNITLSTASIYSAAIVREKGIAELDVNNDAEDWRVISLQMSMLATYVDYISKIIEFYRPSRIIYPQGYVLGSSILRQIGVLKNIPILALENTMHKEKILFDNVSGISVNLNLVRNNYWRNRHLISDETARNYVKSYFENIQKTKQREHLAPQQSFDKLSIKKDKKVAFYIAQVFTDASILFGINDYFKNQADVIAKTAKEVIDRGHIFVIKLHPKERSGEASGIDPILNRNYNQLTLRRLQSSPDFAPYLNHPNVIIDTDNTYNTYDLIDKSDYCITINSQAGLEALIRGKDVILCGLSFYGGLGWTYDARDSQDIGYFIDKICAKPKSTNEAAVEAQKLFYSYLNHSCINRDLASIINLFVKGTVA